MIITPGSRKRYGAGVSFARQAGGWDCAPVDLDGGHDMRPTEVPGPDGRSIRLTDLPSPNTRRWVARRKAEVVAAIDGGLLTSTEACKYYQLSFEELELWRESIDRAGTPGLRVTRIQLYRNKK